MKSLRSSLAQEGQVRASVGSKDVTGGAGVPALEGVMPPLGHRSLKESPRVPRGGGRPSASPQLGPWHPSIQPWPLGELSPTPNQEVSPVPRSVSLFPPSLASRR